MAIGTTAAIIGSAAIGAAGTAYAANSANKAASTAAGAQQAASAEQIALAREQMARSEALLQPYVNQGNRADAYLDALNYGSGSYGGEGSYAGSMGRRAPSEAELMAAYPEHAAYWRRWEAGGAKPGGHRDQFGDFAGYIAAEGGYDPATFQSQQSAANPPRPATTVTRDQVEGQIAESLPYRYADEEFDAQEGLATDAWNRANYFGILAEEEERGALDANYVADNTRADEARADRRAVADEQLQGRLGRVEDSYAAWLPMSQKAEQDAIDLVFSRGGVTGLVGQTRAGVGQTTQNAAMERNLRRYEDVEGAYAPYDAQIWDTESIYQTDKDAALGKRGAGYYDAALRKSDRGYAAQGAYSATQAQNQANRTAGRQNAYADYVAGLNSRSGTGYSAATGQASAGATYADRASDAIGRSADAASQAAYARGQNQQTLYGDVARIAGDAYGAITNRKTPQGIQRASTGTPMQPSYGASKYDSYAVF